MQVINTSRVTVHVPIVNGDGSRDTVTVQPLRGRVTLAVDARVDPEWREPLGVLINRNLVENSPTGETVAVDEAAEKPTVISATIRK